MHNRRNKYICSCKLPSPYLYIPLTHTFSIKSNYLKRFVSLRFIYTYKKVLLLVHLLMDLLFKTNYNISNNQDIYYFIIIKH